MKLYMVIVLLLLVEAAAQGGFGGNQGTYSTGFN